MMKQMLMMLCRCTRCPLERIPITATEPLDLVHMDFIKMEVTISPKKKLIVKQVLVIVDHFSCYIQAYITPNETARTVALTLYENYFKVFGFPRRFSV